MYNYQIQQSQKSEAKYTGSIDCAKKLLREGGIRSLYRGTMATFLRGMLRITTLLLTLTREAEMEGQGSACLYRGTMSTFLRGVLRITTLLLTLTREAQMDGQGSAYMYVCDYMQYVTLYPVYHTA